MIQRSTVLFDLGGVLIKWDPRYLYRKLLRDDETAIEAFLTDVCTQAWNERQDAGRTFAEAEAELVALHPDKADLIRAFGARFDEMIPGALEEVVEILLELKAAGTPLYALTNWSAETFGSQRRRFPFLSAFDGIVVSGEEGLIKPDPRIFWCLLDRFKVRPEDSIFIDDALQNAEAARALGIHSIHFRSAEMLRAELVARPAIEGSICLAS